jgi:hypothetical protein
MSIERSLTKSLRYVSIFDPAIDLGPEGDDEESKRARMAVADKITAYLEAATPDPSTLPVRDGATPAVFELAPLTMRQRARVRQMGDDKLYDKAIEAVACALVSVTGYSRNGEPVTVQRKKVNGEERVTTECLERLFDEELFVELGSRIMAMDRLNPMRASA